MEIKEQVKLRFKGVDFPSIHLNSINPYGNVEFDDDEEEIDIDIRPKALIPADSKNKFKIIIDISLSLENKFSLDVTAIGHFELSDADVDSELRKKFINSNAVAIIFPYVRAFISTLTSNLGKVTKPIIIPTRFFQGDLEQVIQEDLSGDNQIVE